MDEIGESRNHKILLMRQSGLEPHEIAQKLHINRNVVCGVLHRAGMVDRFANMPAEERRLAVHDEVDELNKKIRALRERWLAT